MLTNSMLNYNNKKEHPDAKSVIRSIRVVYFSMILGLVLFLAVTFQLSEGFLFRFDKSDPILFANIFLFLTAIPAGFIVSQAQWKKIDRDLPLKEKLLKYQQGFIGRIATCEGTGLFSIIGFLLSGNLLYIVLTAFALLIIFLYSPSVAKLEMQLELTGTEADELRYT